MGEDAAIDYVVLVMVLALAIPIMANCLRYINVNGIGGFGVLAEKSMQDLPIEIEDSNEWVIPIDHPNVPHLAITDQNNPNYFISGATEETRILSRQDMFIMIAIQDASMAKPSTFQIKPSYAGASGLNKAVIDSAYANNRQRHTQLIADWTKVAGAEGFDLQLIYDSSGPLFWEVVPIIKVPYLRVRGD